ncbi:MAG: hypothetical protein KDB53_14830, partial [Planctomycetes bacterium]|nr:hypothetical protein [Planctomycetota bacterium]
MKDRSLRLIIASLCLVLMIGVSARGQGEESAPAASPVVERPALDERQLPGSADEAIAQKKLIESIAEQPSVREDLREVLKNQVGTLDAIATHFRNRQKVDDRPAELKTLRVEADKLAESLRKRRERLMAAPPRRDDPRDLVAGQEKKVEALAKRRQAKDQELIEARAKAAGLDAEIGEAEAALNLARENLTAAGTALTAETSAAEANAEATEVARERLWLARLRVLAREKILETLNRERELETRRLAVVVVESEQASLVLENEVESLELSRMRARIVEITNEELAQLLKSQAAWEKAKGVATEDTLPFVELKLKEAEYRSDKTKSDLAKSKWAERQNYNGDLGLATSQIREQRDLIALEKLDPEAMVLSSDVKGMRTVVDQARSNLALLEKARDDALAERAKTIVAIRELRSKKVDWEASVEAAKNRLVAAELTAAERESVLGKVNNDVAGQAQQMLAAREERVTSLEELKATLDGVIKDIGSHREPAVANLSFLSHRLLWSRDGSGISLSSVSKAAKDAREGAKRLDEFPRTVFNYFAA